MTARNALPTSGRRTVAFGRPANRIWSLLLTVAVASGLVWIDPGVGHAAAGDLDPSLGGTGTVTANYGQVDIEDFRVMDTATDAAGLTLLAGGTMGGETPDMVVARFLGTGDLDPSFSDDGVAFVDIDGGQDFASAVALAPDGDILLAGGSSVGMNAIGVARLNEDGTYDGTFGDGGRVRVPLPDPTVEVGDVIFDAAGRIVIAAGDIATSDAMWLGLVGATGALDPTFSGDGILFQDFGGSGERAHGLAALPAGGFVSVNESQGYAGTIVTRHAADGSLEATFGVAGVARVAQWRSQAAPALLGDGSMLLSVHVNGGGGAGVARLSTTSGALIPGFGTGGVASTADSTVVASGPPVKLPDGRIIVGATQLNRPAVIMFSDLGVLDPSFGGDGVATTATTGPIGSWDTDHVSNTTDGILVTGTRPAESGVVASQGRPFLAKVDLAGAPVTAFATDGIATPFITSTFYSREDVYDVAVTPGGKLAMAGAFAAAGGFDNEFAVLVVNADGSPSTSFATGGVFTSDFGASGAGAQAIAAQPDGKLVVTGRAGSDGLIARLTEDGQLDPTFGNGAGYVLVDVGEFMDVAIGGDGTITVAVDTDSHDLTAARFTPAGDLDVTFSDDGISSSPGDPDAFLNTTGVAIDSQGRVIISGYGDEAAFARFAPDGSLDATFGAAGGDAGEISAPFPGAEWSYVAGVIVNSDDSLVGFGSGTFASMPDDAVLVKFDAAGAVDASFGDGGLSRFITPDFDFFEGLDVDSTGRLIAAGGFGEDFGVARYTADGVLEGSETVDFPGAREFAMDVAVDSFDRAVAVGPSSFRNSDVSVARFLGDTEVSSTSQATDPGVTVQSGTTPSPSDPVVIAVTPSAGGMVTIVEGDTTATPPAGFEFLGQQIEITAPPGSDTDPIEIVFGIDNATLDAAGVTIFDVGMARNGVVLDPCVTTSPLSPTPACVAGRTEETGFGTITVLTTATSEFNPVKVTETAAATTTTYTGASKGYVAKKKAKLVLSAQLASSDPACVAGRTVTFFFDKDPITEADTAFLVGTVTSSATGAAKLNVSAASWKPGTYQVTVTTSDREGCLGSSSAPATLILQPQKPKGH